MEENHLKKIKILKKETIIMKTKIRLAIFMLALLTVVFLAASSTLA